MGVTALLKTTNLEPGSERNLLPLFEQRTLELQRHIEAEDIDALLITNVDSIYYYTAYWGDLGIDFGRPSMVVVPRAGDITLITWASELLMARAMTWVQNIGTYADGIGGEWRDALHKALGTNCQLRLAVERNDIPAVVANYLRDELHVSSFIDGTLIISRMRMVKSAEELDIIRQAGQVAVAMGIGGRDAIAAGVPEYEVSLAAMAAGTRKAAEIIAGEDINAFMTPMIHNLQSLQSGHFTSYTHMRPRVRRLERGDPVYMCFCNIAHFKQFKLGYDREYFVAEIRDQYVKPYETALQAQAAAFRELRPGNTCAAVHQAALEVYLSAGYGHSYRTGRALGISALEKPELKEDDDTILEPGMVFAVDGGVTLDDVFGARVGDTAIVTHDGHEIVTEYPREMTAL